MATEKLDSSPLLDLSHGLDKINFATLFWPHCLIVASWFPGLRSRFLLSYWVGFLAAAGGGFITSMLMFSPKHPVALLSINAVGFIWTCSWWLVNYCPYDLVHKTIQILPVRIYLKACLNILRASLVANRCQVATELYPGVIAAPLVLGTLAGCGGKLCIDVLTGATGELKGPSELTQPGFAGRSAFLGALLYYVLVAVTGTLTAGEGRALVVVLYVAHGVLSDLAGRPLDFTLPFAKMAHIISNVPMPGAPAKPENVDTSPSMKSKKNR